MRKNTAISLIIAACAILLSGFFLKDSIIFYSMNKEKRAEYAKVHPAIYKKIINLGLDLQGGMRLVLEVDRTHLTQKESGDIQERAYTVIENRINGIGVAEPIIQKQGKDRLIVELPGFRDEGAAKGIIGSMAQLEFNLLREPAELERAIRTIDNVLKGIAVDSTVADSAASDSVKQAKQQAQDKAKMLFSGQENGGDSTTVKAESSGVSTVAGAEKFSSMSEYLVSLGSMIGVTESNKERVKKIMARTDVRNALERVGLGGNTFLWGHNKVRQGATNFYELYYVKSHPEMRGDAIKDARGSINTGGMVAGQAIVQLEMNNRGSRSFARVTGANIGKYLAIVLDSTVYSAPVIRSKISAGSAQIEGSFTMEEAKNLAVVLRAGALPAPVKVIEERTVGPSLGQDSINKGILSSIISIILIVAFMLFYYRASGLVANVGLLINLLFVLGMMASINATLTLPGIAGLILNLGMAVDSNVLIYERIREELRMGKTPRGAIEAGYSRAIVTILDSQLTTLITALILYWLGTGPIKGFAITLIFGIIISLFTQVVITKAIFNLVPISRKDNTLSI